MISTNIVVLHSYLHDRDDAGNRANIDLRYGLQDCRIRVGGVRDRKLLLETHVHDILHSQEISSAPDQEELMSQVLEA